MGVYARKLTTDAVSIFDAIISLVQRLTNSNSSSMLNVLGTIKNCTIKNFLIHAIYRHIIGYPVILIDNLLRYSRPRYLQRGYRV